MTTRDQLHQLLDEIPTNAVDELDPDALPAFLGRVLGTVPAEALAELVPALQRQILLARVNARLPDDEPLTVEDRAAIAEARHETEPPVPLARLLEEFDVER